MECLSRGGVHRLTLHTVLQMLNLELLGTGETSRTIVKKEDIDNVLKNQRAERRQFIELCLSDDPSKRPKASQLLKNPVLQEVMNNA